jgi:hypothetical protein
MLPTIFLLILVLTVITRRWDARDGIIAREQRAARQAATRVVGSAGQ